MNFYRLSTIIVLLFATAVVVYCGREMTEEELFQAAQQHYGQQEYRDAVKMYEKLVQKFPESVNRPKAMFMVGYVCANHLQEFEKAKAVYTELVNTYPGSEFVDDASFELENLGRDPADLDKILQEKISQVENPKKKKQ